MLSAAKQIKEVSGWMRRDKDELWECRAARDGPG